MRSKQSDDIRKKIIEIVELKDGIQQKKLVDELLKLNFSLGAIRGVLYQHETNISNPIPNIYIHKNKGRVYYYLVRSDLDILEKEVSTFLRNVSDQKLNYIDESTLQPDKRSKYKEYLKLIDTLRSIRGKK